MPPVHAEHPTTQPLSLPHTLPKPRLRRPHFWRELLNSVFFIIAALIFSELAFPRSNVDGSSMEPTLWNGNHLLISRVAYLVGEPQHEDIAVFASVEHENEMLVKRVIGLPGDTIEIRQITTTENGETLGGAEVYRNGQLLEEPYFVNRPCRNCRNNTWVLGEDEYFMMGDNRNHSNDSRAFGPVPRENLIGKAIFRYLPFNEIGVLH